MLGAQRTPQLPIESCEGRRVSSIDIRPGRPPFGGLTSRWRTAARAVGLHHATTKPGVVDAFLSLQVGNPCTDVRRTETERVLRAQPFIADARVRTVPDGAGGIGVIVETTDEIPVLVGGSFRGLVPRALSLGNSNVGGEGIRLEARGERGYAYRNGFGLRVVDYATFGRPYVASFEGDRRTLGYLASFGVEHPFYTDLQWVAWHTGYRSSDDYHRLRRPARDELALEVRQERWELSSIARVFGVSTVALIGAGASGVRVTPATAGIVVTDTGLVTDTGTTLRNRYAPFRSGRLGVLGGVRRVQFHTVHGFDALTAHQDVASGVMTGLFVAHGLTSMGENDLFLSSAAYGGVAREHVLLATLAQVEGRRGQGQGEWDSVIGSGRSALYLARSGLLVLLEDQYTAGSRSRLPLQLALGDRQGGILGYRSSSLAGARRNVARAEVRWSAAALVRGADVGVATFTQVGSLWAGDAPYGATATRSAAGISLLAAYPSGSKRLYRADLGIPFSRGGPGGGGVELRFSSEDRTLAFWREPDDVTRARTGAVPANLFAWPTR